MRLPTLCMVMLMAVSLPGQQGPEAGDFSPWLDGYRRDIAGEILAYDSALPEIDSALLARSRAAEQSIAWETQPVPADLEAEWVRFVWLFGLDADAERHRFDLRVGGETWLSFRNPARATLGTEEVAGLRGGVYLLLRTTRIDRHADAFGFATLIVPRRLVVPGQPLRLEIVAEDAGSRVWYMTFRGAPAAGARALPRPALLRDEGRLWQPVDIEIVHLGEPATVRITASFGASRSQTLEFGPNRIPLRRAPVEEAVTEQVRVAIEGGPVHEVAVKIEPVRRWTLHLVQHSHTDIGYTRPQTEILAEHLRYIDYVLDYCDQTDAFPDDARFRWTCEAAWPVREYLGCRPPDQVERFLRRIREGRIEVTALFANLSELLDESSCAASLAPLASFRKLGIPVRSAMQNDVNGVAWCFADYLPELGVRYLSMGQHGHRALVPFERPTAFWWESPPGKRLLAWRPDHYNTGNRWGLHDGRRETVEPALFRYLADLEGKDYPHERVAVQYSGVFLDNAPPGPLACTFIKEWNERYAWPRLRSSTIGEFLERIEQEHADELPVHRQAWPDWWSDGVASAPREVAAAREAQSELLAVEGLLAMEILHGGRVPQALLTRLAAARERLVVYGEHTYGAAESVSDPDGENTRVQWAQKASSIWEAVKEIAQLREGALGLQQARVARAEVPIVVVTNTLGTTRSGLVEVQVDRPLQPEDGRLRFVDAAGAAAPAQLLEQRSDVSRWAVWARDLPAFGHRSWRIESGQEAPASEAPDAPVLENRFYRLEIDPETGTLASLFDKELGRDLAPPGASRALVQVIHETLGNRSQLEHFALNDYRRKSPHHIEIGRRSQGPIWQSLEISGSGAMFSGRGSCRVEIRLLETTKRIELHFRIRKRPSYEPESLYVAFPFRLDRPRFRFETAGGVVDPARDQLPGTSSDWQAVQGFVSVTGEDVAVHLSSPDTLLFQLGGLNLGRFEFAPYFGSPEIYSWVLNNYWVTNFRASTDGELRWSYALTSTTPGSAAAATRFGWETRVPLLARVLPPGRARAALEAGGGLLDFGNPDVLLVGARPSPDGRAVILHLREIAGGTAVLDPVRWVGEELAAIRVHRVDALGAPRGAATTRITLGPREAAFFRVIMD